jgi:glycyl-tRNA synthetase beta chain
MGKEYARLDGHPEEVSQAIHEHYLPARSGDELPSAALGAIVGAADRMDTITGCFAIQLEPTGAADPFALRRHALAIIRIIENMAWDISIKDFISTSLSILNETLEFECDPVLLKVTDFFRERYRNMMLGTGYKSDLIEAVISVAFDRVYLVRDRIDQLQKFMTSSDEFESLVLTFKRITNILKKQEETRGVKSGLFKEPCEFKLWDAYHELSGEIIELMERRAYFEALNLLVKLRKPVDDLFDEVEIMTKENTQLRDNRVGMLQHLSRLFLSLADFSKFSI